MQSPQTMPMRDPVQWIARKHRLSDSAAALVIELAGLGQRRNVGVSSATPSSALTSLVTGEPIRIEVERGVR